MNPVFGLILIFFRAAGGSFLGKSVIYFQFVYIYFIPFVTKCLILNIGSEPFNEEEANMILDELDINKDGRYDIVGKIGNKSSLFFNKSFTDVGLPG